MKHSDYPPRQLTHQYRAEGNLQLRKIVEFRKQVLKKVKNEIGKKRNRGREENQRKWRVKHRSFEKWSQ